jgi:predicted SnoaL-like aldol condensation-catalyzing enzyme
MRTLASPHAPVVGRVEALRRSSVGPASRWPASATADCVVPDVAIVTPPRPPESRTSAGRAFVHRGRKAVVVDGGGVRRMPQTSHSHRGRRTPGARRSPFWSAAPNCQVNRRRWTVRVHKSSLAHYLRSARPCPRRHRLGCLGGLVADFDEQQHRAAYEAMAKGDTAPIRALMADDYVQHMPAFDITVHGRERTLDLISRIFGRLGITEYRLERVEQQGDFVITTSADVALSDPTSSAAWMSNGWSRRLAVEGWAHRPPLRTASTCGSSWSGRTDLDTTTSSVPLSPTAARSAQRRRGRGRSTRARPARARRTQAPVGRTGPWTARRRRARSTWSCGPSGSHAVAVRPPGVTAPASSAAPSPRPARIVRAELRPNAAAYLGRAPAAARRRRRPAPVRSCWAKMRSAAAR